MPDTIKDLEQKAREIRILTLESIGKLGVGHVGGALSICDLLVVLYFKEMNVDPKKPKMENRDRLVVSKGHSGPALYSALALKGYFDKAQLDTLNGPNTNLPSHADRLKTTGIDMSTGSLGQGFSAAVGMAVAGHRDNLDLNIYTIIGDGESQEGQIWEAAMFAGSQKLDNIIAFTDYNNMQIDGTIDDVNTLEPIADKWNAFNWHTQLIDGHDIGAIINAISNAKNENEKPSMIILKTIKGKGADFAEGKITSHNMAVTEEMWKDSVEKLKAVK